MNKRIVIRVGSGTLATGYTAAVQIGDEGTPPQVETQAMLPPAADLKESYRQWQQAYRQMGLPSRLETIEGETNFSDIARLESCRRQSRQLRDRVHEWLNSSAFQPIREKVLEQLSPTDTVRVLLQTSDPFLQRLPWYELDFFQRYRSAEVGICSSAYQQVYYSGSRSKKVRILAVLGDNAGLDTAIDKALLKNLAGADIHFLESPSCQEVTRALWNKQGWDILFFAGHSNSNRYLQNFPPQKPECGGEIWLSSTEKLTIPQLRHALRKAIDRGLNTAIFNSCDGLGLAADLADLHIPQVLVMREPVPDQVAHAFLQGFLESFSDGVPFYTAVRDAREKLQGLESHFPCATWLPVIVQNLAEVPPTWQSLQGKTTPDAVYAASTVALPSHSSTDLTQMSAVEQGALDPKSDPRRSFIGKLKVGVGCGLAIAALLTAGRFLKLLEPFEIKGYDYLLRTRPTELPDSNILIVTNTAEDIEAFPNPTGSSSFSDDTLLKLLNKLTLLEPAVIGLDVYHGHSEKAPALKEKLRETNNLIAICKDNYHTEQSIVREPPPPEIDNPFRVGANDFVAFQTDGEVLRRQLLQLSPPSPNSPCLITETSEGPAINSFSTLVALAHLETVLGSTQTELVPERFWLTEQFGGYRATDAAGTQIMLNYRITKDPKQTNCGGVKETPADCLTVSDVLEQDPGDLSPFVEGKTVLIGTTDTVYAAADRWRTPYTQSPYTKTDEAPGVFLHAQMVSQLINHQLENRPFIGTWFEWQEILWIALWALIGSLIGAYSKQKLHLSICLLLSAGLLWLITWLWFIRVAIWTPWIPAIIALPTATLTAQIATHKNHPPKHP
ncbi:MAG: CHASE2 domain-containing protein [Cyanobacteria bacterium P01_D01_bin.1]